MTDRREGRAGFLTSPRGVA